MMPIPRIDEQRLWASLMEMARIGATAAGGCRRLALSDEDRAARDLYIAWCRSAGLTIRIDRIGNIFARREGRNPSLAPVGSGSHLDTQPHGGRFDGVYGVLAALEAVRTLNAHSIETEAPLEIAVWTNEEGARFAPAMLGSGVHTGAHDLDFALTRRDRHGVTVGAALERIDYAGPEPCAGHTYRAFFEAHIEQGPILEREGLTIGVVTGVQGLDWYDLRIGGEDAHAGSTPMAVRRDALTGAARMIIAIQDIARDKAPHGVATVGEIHASPGSRNTIAGAVELTLDMRHPDARMLSDMGSDMRSECAAIARRNGLELTVESVEHAAPVAFAPACVASVRNAAEALGYPLREMLSGAGHDACHLAEVVPTGMIFVPCAGGLSHNEAESATPADLAAGCNVLLHALLDYAASAP